MGLTKLTALIKPFALTSTLVIITVAVVRESFEVIITEFAYQELTITNQSRLDPFLLAYDFITNA